MDNDLFEKGLAKRKATLGAEYVENNLAAADEFTRPFQEAMTAWCWGFGWGDEVIEPKTRSMMNLARATGLVEELDRQVDVLKVHLPYHESIPTQGSPDSFGRSGQ